MINCRQLIDFCFEYLDGALPDKERSHFKEHLELCPDCVSFFETYRRTPEVTREALALEMPASVKESVRSYLKRKLCE